MTWLWCQNSAVTLRRYAQIAACLFAILAAPTVAGAEQFRWSDVQRVVAISDPHGAYDALLGTLKNAAVIDDNRQWIGGQTHLVITGDLLDRGADSRKIMDLVMALESQAPESGGMVHLTLGNHEVMNLVGDLRYVASGEYAAFAAEETAEARERWFRIFSANRDSEEDAGLREEFDRDRPPGFYAHRQAFSSDGYYGKWLLTKPVMVVINDTAYVHGGLPALVADYSLEELNEELRSQVVDYVKQTEALTDIGFLDPAANFYTHADVAELLAADTTLPANIHAAAETVIELSGASIHGTQSPLWYRGTVGCSTVIENDTLQGALDAVDAARVVIGHTPTLTREVLQKHGGRVIEIDTGMLNAAYQGVGFALIIEGDKVSVVNEQSAQATSPVEHPRRVGRRPDNLASEELERILQSGSIVGKSTDAAGQEIVELVSDETKIAAIFTKNPRNRGFSPVLATYRLDRLLGLDMVPVTVAREVDGKRGALQFHPERTRDEGERAASGRGSEAWCPLPRQWNAMYIFDALIYNEGRLHNGMQYSPDNWQLILSGNANTFGSKRNKPKYLEQAPMDFGESWIAALESLTDERLAERLSDVLDKRRLVALSKRRDMLLKDARSQ